MSAPAHLPIDALPSRPAIAHSLNGNAGATESVRPCAHEQARDRWEDYPWCRKCAADLPGTGYRRTVEEIRAYDEREAARAHD